MKRGSLLFLPAEDIPNLFEKAALARLADLLTTGGGELLQGAALALIQARRCGNPDDDVLVAACADRIQQYASDATGGLPQCEGAAPARAWTMLLAAAGEKLDRSAVADAAARCTRIWLARTDAHT